MPKKAGKKPGITFALPDRLLILLFEMDATKEYIDEINVNSNDKEIIFAQIELSSIGLSKLLNVDNKYISDTIRNIDRKEGITCIKKTDRNYKLIPGKDKKKILSRSAYEIHFLTEHGKALAKNKLDELKKSFVRIKDENGIINKITVEECNNYIKSRLDGQKRYFFYALMGDLVQEKDFSMDEIFKHFPFQMDIQYSIRLPKDRDVTFQEFIEEFIPSSYLLFDKFQELSKISKRPETLIKQEYNLKGENDKEDKSDEFSIKYIYEVIRNSQFTFVTGESGSGKSTLLSQISRYSLFNSQSPMYPIYMEFSSYDGGSIKNWIINKLRKEIDNCELEYGLEQAIEEKRLIIIIDGLDENPSKNDELLNNIKVLNKEYLVIKYVISSRCHNFHNFRGSILTILPLKKENRNNFIKSFMNNEDKSERIINEFNNDLNLNELSLNPMFLNILCVLFNESRNIPRNRFQIYEEMVRFFIDWGSHRLNNNEFKYDELKKIYSWIAYYLTDNKHTIFQLNDIKNNNNIFDQIDITQVIERSVLSDSIFIQIGKGYKFFHKSFQEYFTSIWVDIENDIDYVINNMVKDIDWWYPVLLIYSSNKNVSNIIKYINLKWDEDIFFLKIRMMSRLAIEGYICDDTLKKNIFVHLIHIYLKEKIWEKDYFTFFSDTKNRIGSFNSLMDDLAVKINNYDFLKNNYLKQLKYNNIKFDYNNYHSLSSLLQTLEFITNSNNKRYILRFIEKIYNYIKLLNSSELLKDFYNNIVYVFNNYDKKEKDILDYVLCLDIVKEEKETLFTIKNNIETLLMKMKKNELIENNNYVHIMINFISRILFLLDPNSKSYSHNLSKDFWLWMKDVIYLNEIDSGLRSTIFNILKEDMDILTEFSPEGFSASFKSIEDNTYHIERRIWVLENDTDPRNKWISIVRLSSFISSDISNENKIILSKRICDICERLIENESDLVLRNGMIGLIYKYGSQNYLNKIIKLHDDHIINTIWINDINTSIDNKDIQGEYKLSNDIRYLLRSSITYIHSIILNHKCEEYFDDQIQFAIRNLDSNSIDCSRLSFDFLLEYGDNENHFQAVKWLLKSGYRFQIQIIEEQDPLAIDPRIFPNIFTIFLNTNDYIQLCNKLHPFYKEDEKLKNGLNSILIIYPGIPDEDVLMDSMDLDIDYYRSPLICNYILAVDSRGLLTFDQSTSIRIVDYIKNVIKLYLKSRITYNHFDKEFLQNLIVLIDRFKVKPDIVDMISLLDDISDLKIDNLRYYLMSYTEDEWISFKNHINKSISSSEKKKQDYDHFIKYLDLYKTIPDNNYKEWKKEFHQRIFEFYDEMRDTPEMVWIFDDFFDDDDIPILLEKYNKWKDYPINQYILMLIYKKSCINNFNKYIINELMEEQCEDYSSIIYNYIWEKVIIGEISDDGKYNLLYIKIWNKCPNQRVKLLTHRFSSQHFIENYENENDNEIIRSGIISLSKSCSSSLVHNEEIKVKIQDHKWKIISFIETYLSSTKYPDLLSSCLIILKNLNPDKFIEYIHKYLKIIIELKVKKDLDYYDDTFINPTESTTISLPFFLMEAIEKGSLIIIDHIMRLIELKIIKDPETYISNKNRHYQNIGIHLCEGAKTSNEIMEYVRRYPVLLPLVVEEIDYHFHGSGYFSRKEIGLEEITYDLENTNS